MKKVSKIISIMLVALMVSSVISGCREDAVNNGERKLELWLGNHISSYVTDYNDIKAFQIIQDNLGIEVDFVHPSSALWEEQFNIMLASEDFSDLIQWNWNTKYVGGADAAISDGVIVDLTNYMDKLPNYKKVLDENTSFGKTVKTLEGNIPYFASVGVPDPSLGPMIRKDWLDKLGLEIPKTMDDWYNVLKAFKEKDPNGNGKADEIPFASHKSPAFNSFAAAYGTLKSTMYVKDGKVVYGSIQPEFKEFITEMAKWYKEGLIDSEFAALEKTVYDSYMSGDISGATINYVGSGMSAYLSANKDNSEYNLVAAPWPSKTTGATAYNPRQMLRQGGDDQGTALTTSCKDIDLALEFMDYLYSEEGTTLLNWGIEGETYTVENGEKKFTDYVVNNSEGLSPLEVMMPISFTSHGLVGKIMDADAYKGIQYNKPAQADAFVQWSSGDYSLMTDTWPMTADEKSRVSAINTEMQAYEEEMYTKMIMGVEPIENFDKFVAEMEKFGVRELEKIHQTAYERYMAD